jgi:threonine dehydrogenase-like Zn-dependent dehydrogenase
MDHLVYVEPGRVEWQATDDPLVTEASAAVVRPLAVARCDLDLPMANLGLFPGPFAVGFKRSGRGGGGGLGGRAGAGGRPRARAVQVSCGGCATCASGRYAAYHVPCAGGAALGFGTAGGGHGGTVADLLAFRTPTICFVRPSA